METLGIDIGGSAVKGSVVNITEGKFSVERHKIELNALPSVGEITQAVVDLVNHFQWKGPIGCGFPAVIKNGVICTAANIDKKFIGVNAQELFRLKTENPVYLYNDADAAGYAELKFGHVANFQGLAIFLTVGTGIGSALLYKGELLPNTEFGHIYMKNGKKGEKYASDAVRKTCDLSWDAWGERFNEYLSYLESLFNPDLFIIGGGTSKKFDKFSHKITIPTRVIPAKLLNDAGIIGAASLAAKELS